mgnify:CR=1 FL=1
MAKKFRFELNMPGLNELMKSAEMQSVLDQKGAQVAAAAGNGYNKRTHVADFVAITNVYANTKEAKRENLRDNTLLKALNAGKG